MNPPVSFKSIQILYLALLIGQILIALVMGLQIKEMESGDTKMFTQMGMIALAMLAGAGTGSFLIYRKRVEQAVSVHGLPAKMEHYRLSNIIRWAMLEGANLIIIVFAFIEANSKLLWFFAIGAAVFLLARPSKEGFASDYQLTSQEQAELG